MGDRVMDRLVLHFPHLVRWELCAWRNNVRVLVASSPLSRDVVLSSSEHYGSVIESLTIGDATVFTGDVPPGHLLVLDRYSHGPSSWTGILTLINHVDTEVPA